jgi:hypothetical protein
MRREQLGGGRPALGDHAERPRRESGSVGRGAEDEGRQRRQRAGSEDDRVTGHEGRHQLLERHDDGAVVGGDGGDHADRFVAAQAEGHPVGQQLVGRHGVGLLVRQRQVEVDRRAGEAEAHAELRALGVHPGLSRLRHHRRHQRLAGLLDVVEERAQPDRPLGGRQVGPHALVERAPGLLDGPLDLTQRRGRHLGDHRLVGRVLDRERRVALDPSPGDVRAPGIDQLGRHCRSPRSTTLVERDST